MAVRKKKTDSELLGNVEAYRLEEDAEFNPEILLDQLQTAIVNNFDFRVATQFDEREIPRYANFYEFTKRGLGVKAFPRQLQVVMQAYGEICMFCSDHEWANNMHDQTMDEILEHVVFMRFGKCPKCGKTRFDMIVNRHWYFPNRIALLVGQRGGKNMTLGMASLYQDHLYLTLEVDQRRVAPYEYFGLLPTFVRQAFTGVTATQAFDNVWDQIVSIRKESPWYNTYFEFLKFHGQRLGQELYKVSDTFVSYHHKRMGVTIKAPDKRKLRGATRYFCGIDEICWFNSSLSEAAEKKVGDVKEVWVSLNNSLRTIRNAADQLMRAGRYDVPNALSMDISSPFDVNDILSQHMREARQNQRIYAGHYATWEFNPNYTQESLAEEFVKDPEVAWRDFGAIPPLANSPWLNDPKAVIDIVRPLPDPPYVSYRQRSETNPYGDATTWFEVDKVNLGSGAHIIAIDNGLVNNAFACCIGSLDAGKIARIDVAFMLKPPTNTKVNLDKMFTDFVKPLVERSNCVALIYDHWNSIQNVQHMRDQGIDARQYTLLAKDFVELRQAIFSKTVSLPFTEYPLNSLLDRSADVDLIQTSLDKPNFSLVLQTLTVREIGGGKVVKPKYGDDDVFRTMALAYRFLNDEELLPKIMAGGMGAGPNRNGPRKTIGVIAHASRGTAAAGGSGGRSVGLGLVRGQSGGRR